MEYIIKNARFISSSPNLKGCPSPSVPEFAFIGRSNVGKSSLINMLTSNRNLAKTSSTPGKTKLINHFLINDSWYLVDLPGYGYAKVSKEQRSEFRQSIMEYIGKRKTLYCLYVLIDARLEPQAVDLRFINWLGENEVAFAIIFTKIDKVSQNEWHKNVEKFRDALRETWEELPLMMFSSSIKKTGREEILDHIIKAI